MLDKTHYANGQAVYSLAPDRLTYYYKNGQLKAEGPFRNNQMEGEWHFYRETGQLWQVGHFEGNQKHGSWLRYDRAGKLEFSGTFANGSLVK